MVNHFNKRFKLKYFCYAEYQLDAECICWAPIENGTAERFGKCLRFLWSSILLEMDQFLQ